MQRPESTAPDEQLIEALTRLAPARAPDQPDRTNRAALAALRRGLGQAPGAVPEMFRYLPQLARVAPWRERDAFLVASLFAWHPCPWLTAADDQPRARARWARNLGNSLAWLVADMNRSQRGSSSGISAAAPPAASATAGSQPGVERRWLAVLAADREDVDHHLRALVGLLRQQAVPVDWLQLLRDLGAWDRPDREVQRRWARSFWGGTSPELPPASEAADAATGDAETTAADAT